MHIIHGTWIPDNSHDFIQRGAFYLWVETDTLDESLRHVDAVHPRHLMHTALSTFLIEKLDLQNTTSEALERALCIKYFLLPTFEGRPAPSFELLRYVDEEEPAEFDMQPWQVNCYRILDVITVLNDIHFTALYAAEDFQLGADFLFWYEYVQMFKGVVAREQYIPALKYQVIPSTAAKSKQRSSTVTAKSKPVKDNSRFEIHPAWELLSDTYEASVQSFAAAMPTVCTAGLNIPDDAALFDKESLLRHFSESLLHDSVIGTPFTGKFDQQIAGTILYHCIYPDLLYNAIGLADYKYWLAWRANFTREHVEAGFTLCFQLDEARADDIDNWQLHFLVAARSDPSLKLSLEEYWRLKSSARTEAARLFGQDFEKNLLLTLGYAARIYAKIWSGLATEHPTGCRLTLDEAFSFLKESAWVLSDAGYIIIVPSWWTAQGRRRTKVRLKTASRSSQKGNSDVALGRLSLKSIISYQYQLSVGGQEVTPEEWLQLVNAKTPLVQFRGQWIELDREKMQELLLFWQTHQDEEAEITLQDMLKVEAESEDDLEWEHDQYLTDILSRLHNKDSFAPIGELPGLQGSLRDYQKRGVAWLQYLESLGLNPCLADDMGLGKTLEVIACLVKERDGLDDDIGSLLPTLVIAPTSVLGNWRKEIERFAPQIRTLVHQGGARRKGEESFEEACQTHDVILTSFALARLDEKLLKGIKWHRVVVDEAQNIKNPQAAQTRAIMKLNASHKLALTGTPVENRLRDLWSIFNFLNPGYLGKEAQFRKTFELPIYKNNDVYKLSTLKKLVEPFILRRVKTDKRIINDLPDKIEQKMYCTLTPEQASLYEVVVKDVEAQLEEAEGIQRRGLILSTILKLKQICNHPAQFLQDDSAFTPERSHKFQRLNEMIEELIESGESALIFTQFTVIGEALSRYLEHTKHYNTYYLHGGTNVARRERMVTEFQDPATEPSLFILSLRAGGVGLNLTKANHVFHFDRWWNPSVEDQATDRAFRIGQRKNVFVHKFVAMGTMEERIDAMIEDKKRMSSMVVGSDEAWLTELDNDTFKDLIALRRSSVME